MKLSSSGGIVKLSGSQFWERAVVTGGGMDIAPSMGQVSITSRRSNNGVKSWGKKLKSGI